MIDDLMFPSLPNLRSNELVCGFEVVGDQEYRSSLVAMVGLLPMTATASPDDSRCADFQGTPSASASNNPSMG
jgi:hypothetical protein